MSYLSVDARKTKRWTWEWILSCPYSPFHLLRSGTHQIPSESPEPSTVPGKEQLSRECALKEWKRGPRFKRIAQEQCSVIIKSLVGFEGGNELVLTWKSKPKRPAYRKQKVRYLCISEWTTTENREVLSWSRERAYILEPKYLLLGSGFAT